MVAVLALPSPVVEASSRSSGDFWSYDIDAVVEAVPVSGVQDFEFMGSEPVSSGGVEVDADVFKVSGRFSGNTSVAGVNKSVTGTLDGWSYAAHGTDALVADDLTTFVNVTHGIGTFLMTTLMEMHETVLYSPPLLSGLEDSLSFPGATWNETVEVYRTSSFYNGTSSYVDDEEAEEVYQFSVVSVNEPVETLAGEFRCTLINVSYESGWEHVWCCPDAGRPVRVERYDFGSPDTVFRAVLSEYEFGSDDDMLLPLVAAGVAASACAFLIVVVLAVRRSRGDIDSVRCPADQAGLDEAHNLAEDDNVDDR